MLRIRDVYPGSWFLPIPDPGSRIQKQQQKRGVKKICCHNFLCSHKFHKIAHYFSFDVLKKKMWANFQRIIEPFTQKIVNKFSKLWIWDPRSGKDLFRIPGSKRHRIPDPYLQHWFLCFVTSFWLVSLKYDVNVPSKIIMQKNLFLKSVLSSIKKMTGSGSGSICQRHGSPDLDPHQNVMDPQHWH